MPLFKCISLLPLLIAFETEQQSTKGLNLVGSQLLGLEPLKMPKPQELLHKEVSLLEGCDFPVLPD